jgi:outer membrane protein OmpA-like peptidoglycan-associated protein
MTNEFIGSDIAAFNEYRLFLSYHFSLEHNFGNKFAAAGSPLPKAFPEANVALSETKFTPDGSGPTRSITLAPRAASETGVLSWKLFIRNAQGETVRHWEGNGVPPAALQWEGLAPDGKPLPNGTYRVTLQMSDLYGNEATSPAQMVEIQSAVSLPAGGQAPAPAGTNAYRVTATMEGLKVTLSSLVLFDVNKTDLKASAKESLNQVIQLLKAYPTNVLRISGHTDATGGESYNQKLSERRAQTVADYLVDKGAIAASRIKVVGYGKRRPVASNGTEEGRQKNRRVEIDILK